MNVKETNAASPFVRRTRKVFYHPNTMAPQRTVGKRMEDDTVHPTFDWRNAVCLKLDLMDLAQILQVLRGVQESLADGKGLFHRSANGSAVIKFEHRIEPIPGYMLDVSKKPLIGDVSRVCFFFRPAEAFACALMLEHALVYVAFGIPTVIPRIRPGTSTAAGEMNAVQAVSA